MSGGLAVAYGLHCIEPIGEDHPRAAVGPGHRLLRRAGGTWQVIHEHVSLPFDPRTGQVSYITDDTLERTLSRS